MTRTVLVVLALFCTPTNAFVRSPVGNSPRRWINKLSAATLEKNAEGLEYVQLKHDSGAKSQVYLFGGDVTQYSDADGTEWIKVRPDAKMDGSKPISGGLSHCFPQFGPGNLQQHGFARNVDWTVHSMDDCSVTLKLEPSDYTMAMWAQEFEVLFTTRLTAESLDTSMTVTNKGGNSFDFQAALHSYFDLSDISQASVSGSFKGAKFLNKLLDPPAMQEETRDEIVIAEEYDRVYMDVNDCTLKDNGKGKALKIVNSGGWKDTVVWSPYGNDGMGYKTFVCVESVAFDSVTLPAGSSWEAELKLIPTAL